MRGIFFDSWGDLRFGWGLLLILVPAIAIPIATIIVIDKHDCAIYMRTTDRQTKYVFATCYVKTEHGFIPRDEFNARAITSEIIIYQNKMIKNVYGQAEKFPSPKFNASPG